MLISLNVLILLTRKALFWITENRSELSASRKKICTLPYFAFCLFSKSDEIFFTAARVGAAT